MKALVKAAAEPGLWLGERAIPQIGPDDVLIKVNKTGICGTDIHIYAWDDWAQRTTLSRWSSATSMQARSLSRRERQKFRHWTACFGRGPRCWQQQSGRAWRAVSPGS